MTPPTIRESRSGVQFAAAIFLSSSLLFLIEPIAAKRLLPLLGGSAAVWTACLVFFQCALLLGYGLAHWLATRPSPRLQAGMYAGLLVAALGQLVWAVNPDLHASSDQPISSVLRLLTILIGLPFVTLSATSPLLQAWYARSVAMENPAGTSKAYRLFAISNVGSLLSLLVYPWLVEPKLSLHDQTAALAAGFGVLALVCGGIAWRLSRTTAAPVSDQGTVPSKPAPAATVTLWICLAACGSLLLSTVTNHLSQNVATIPLLWIIPLVAYLLTFVIAFADERWHPRAIVIPLAIVGLGLSGYYLYKGTLTMPVARAVGIFCGGLFALCLFCHSELYRRRPAAAHLTYFYICVATGGAIGAILVGIVAPTVMNGNWDFGIALIVVATLAMAATWRLGMLARLGSAVALGFTIWIVSKQVSGDRALYRVRNFYGTLRVTQDSDEAFLAWVRTLSHGGINHGQQVFRADLDTTPTTYYGHPSGVGLSVDLCCTGRPRRIGVIGLGTGTMAAYGKPGDVIRFYDINPAVPPISRGMFTYLSKSRAHIDVVPGDARVSMEKEPPQRYDVIVVDAFSGDAIPVHLITAQALDVYERHLRPGGIVAFHVSNRYLSLGPVVQELAEHARLGVTLISNGDASGHDIFSSDWVLVSSDTAFLARPELDKDREEIKRIAGLRLWTDDYNSLLPILKTRRDTTE